MRKYGNIRQLNGAVLMKLLPKLSEAEQRRLINYVRRLHNAVKSAPRPIGKKEGFLKNPFLKSTGRIATVASTKGRKTIAQAHDVFTAGIDDDFIKWKLDIPSKARPKMVFESFEIVRDGTLKDFFSSFGVPCDALVSTDEQIIGVAKNYRHLLSKNDATLFLMKKKRKFFFVSVRWLFDGRCKVRVHRFSYDCVWDAESRCRVVVPLPKLRK